VAACTEFAQHGVGRAVSQRLEIRARRLANGAIDCFSGRLNDTPAGMHQAVPDRRDLVGMTRTTRCRGIIEITWKAGHAGVCVIPGNAGFVAAMADRAVMPRERVRLNKAAALAGMTLITCVTGLLTERRGRPADKTGKAQDVNGSASHIQIVIVLMLSRYPAAMIGPDYE
jgi:hypothetical protein